MPASERELALHVAENRETWEKLLKRPFLTLKADGPYIFDRTEVTAQVVNSLGSSSAPPSPLRLTLTRFQLEGIDTKWRVTSVRRADAPAPSEPKPTPTPTLAAPPPASYDSNAPRK